MTEPAYSGWPEPACRLVERAVQAHGGWPAWRRLATIEVEIEDLGGPLPRVKGIGHTHHMAPRARVTPKLQLVSFSPHPKVGLWCTFERGNVSSARDERSHEIVESSPDHRKRFGGFRKNRRWSDLDAAYFFGYALVTYFSLPFVLAETRWVASLSRGGLDGVTVAFDASYPTHSIEQSFYFDSSGLLRRHDYVADVVGAWARGAHFSDDYERVDGLMLAHSRRVVFAPFGRASFIPVLHARFGEFRVSFDAQPGIG